MRHKKSGRKLGRRADHRKAMVKNLAESLILHGRIETTVTRAKEVRSYVEKLVTRARKGDLHARRIVMSRLHTLDAARKLVDEIAPNYKDRDGGYTRILKTRARRGDASEMAILEFVEAELKKKKKKKAAPKKKEAAKATAAPVEEEAIAPEAEAEVEADASTEASAEDAPAEEPAAEVASDEAPAEEPAAEAAAEESAETPAEEAASEEESSEESAPESDEEATEKDA